MYWKRSKIYYSIVGKRNPGEVNNKNTGPGQHNNTNAISKEKILH